MLIYFFIIFILYFIFILILLYGWEKIPLLKDNQDDLKGTQFVSIVVAVRNEAKNITKLLASLEYQNYPRDHFEVVIVDDQSEDETAQLILDFAANSSLKIILLHSQVVADVNQSPKKSALTQGISEAKGKVIMTTDGDCRMGVHWLRSMLSLFNNQRLQFVSGPVMIESTGKLFSKVQSMEFSSLIGSGASLIQLNYPLMCNGANLAFRKAAFLKVNGYGGTNHRASGDDVYLMQKIHNEFSEAVAFNKSPEAIVQTDAVLTLKDLVAQRRRWASKWNSYKLTLSEMIPVFLFLHYLSFIGIIFISIFNHTFLSIAVGLVLLKFIFDYLFLKKVMNFCNLQMGVLVFLLSEVLYPFYAIFIGILVHFGKWDWKGRRQKI